MWPYIIAAPYFMAQSNSLIIPYLHLSHPYTGVEEEGKEGEYQWVCTTPPFFPQTHTENQDGLLQSQFWLNYD
jgi:hypothetical protein